MDEHTKKIVDTIREATAKFGPDRLVSIKVGHLRSVLEALDAAHNDPTVLEVPAGE